MLLDFFDVSRNKKISVPFHNILSVEELKKYNENAKTVISYNQVTGIGRIWVEEEYEEVVNYIKTGKWARIK